MFGIIIVNHDEGFYLHMRPENALAKAENKNKALYLQVCLYSRRTFNPMVYSEERINQTEAMAAQKRSSALPIHKIKREYSDMGGFVLVGISLAIVRSNSLLLISPREKAVHIRHTTSH